MAEDEDGKDAVDEVEKNAASVGWSSWSWWGWKGSPSWYAAPEAAEGAETTAAAASASASSSGSWVPWQSSSWWQYRGTSWPDREKKDLSDPSSFPGFGEDYRAWKHAVRRWENNTDHAEHKRGDRLMRVLTWKLQEEIQEELGEAAISSKGAVENILKVLDQKAGVEADAEEKEAYHHALFEMERRKDETFADYARRRSRQMSTAHRFGLALPSDVQGRMLIEGARLSHQNEQNLKTLLAARTDVASVTEALQKLDIPKQNYLKQGPRVYVEHGADSDDESVNTEEEAEILATIDEQDLDECEGRQVLAAIEQQRKRTWQESQKLKQAMRKDRKFFETRDVQRGVGKQGRIRSKKRLTKEQLMQITRCSNCGERGHWAESCSKPYRSREDREADEKGGTGQKGKTAAFCYLGGPGGTAGLTLTVFRDLGGLARRTASELVAKRMQAGKVREESDIMALLVVDAGEAVVDTAAGQALMGEKSLESLSAALRQRGLRVVEVPTTGPAPRGVGGRAEVIRSVLVPLCMKGKTGVALFIILRGDIPPLLPIGLLESLEAEMDLKTNQLNLRALGVRTAMRRLPSGHRVISVCDPLLPGEDFVAPEALRERYGLDPCAFRIASQYKAEFGELGLMGGRAKGTSGRHPRLGNGIDRDPPIDPDDWDGGRREGDRGPPVGFGVDRGGGGRGPGSEGRAMDRDQSVGPDTPTSGANSAERSEGQCGDEWDGFASHGDGRKQPARAGGRVQAVGGGRLGAPAMASGPVVETGAAGGHQARDEADAAPAADGPARRRGCPLDAAAGRMPPPAWIHPSFRQRVGELDQVPSLQVEDVLLGARRQRGQPEEGGEELHRERGRGDGSREEGHQEDRREGKSAAGDGHPRAAGRGGGSERAAPLPAERQAPGSDGRDELEQRDREHGCDGAGSYHAGADAAAADGADRQHGADTAGDDDHDAGGAGKDHQHPGAGGLGDAAHGGGSASSDADDFAGSDGVLHRGGGLPGRWRRHEGQQAEPQLSHPRFNRF